MKKVIDTEQYIRIFQIYFCYAPIVLRASKELEREGKKRERLLNVEI